MYKASIGIDSVVSKVRNLSKISFVRTFAIFFTGSLLATIINMIAGLLAARIAGPLAMGIFTSATLVLSYAPIVQLGVLNGLNRELPYYIGKGKFARVNVLAASAQWYAILTGTISSLITLGIAFFQVWRGNYIQAAAWATVAIAMFFVFYVTMYLRITYRTNTHFRRLAGIDFIKSITNLVGVSTVYLFGFWGLCIKYLAVSIIEFFITWKDRPIKVKPKYSFKHIKHLFIIGFPNFAVGYYYSVWDAINASMVLYFSGVKGLGLYSIAVLTFSTFNILVQSINQMIYPRLAQKLGEGKSYMVLFRFASMPGLVSFVCLIPVAFLGWYLLPIVTKLLLPKYTPGIVAAQWNLIPALIMSTSSILNFFTTVKKQNLFAIAVTIGLLFNAIALLLLRHVDTTLSVYPKAMIFGRLTFIVSCYILAYKAAAKQTYAATVK